MTSLGGLGETRMEKQHSKHNACARNGINDYPMELFHSIALRIISARTKKMAAFSLRLGLTYHFFCCFELSNKFLYVT